MYIKKSLKLLFERSIFHLKSLKIIFWIPLVILNVFLPIMNYLQYKTSGFGELLYLNIIQYAQMFIPFCSVWWVIFIARQYVETDGNELYFVTKAKSKIGDYLIPFGAFFVAIFNCKYCAI